MSYSTVQETKCGGIGVKIGCGTLPYATLGGGGRSEHWVGYPTLPLTLPLPYQVQVGCSSYEMSNVFDK